MFNKILITGNAGAGKTTLANKLAKLLNMQEIIHLDNIVWKNHWQLVDKNTKEMRFAEIAKERTWIVDGVSKTVMEAADTIFFLDYPRRICYARALKRTCKYLFYSRPELIMPSPEILVIGKLLRIIWNFPNAMKPIIIKHIEKNSDNKKIFHIKNNNDLQDAITFLTSYRQHLI